ncbi:helix-turn-helix transcriptional regulator [Mycobacteroides immunogenum]|uniref:helix-turn-helix domain-containing protein n=1 Tax=Mycobacteroides immunogenum TaxID=83262 RepID=UPI0025B7791D|nr:helix-turn-helix transcriptional regulator [Mycobacteroides immunogenum]WJR33394.1 helix-turn-helix transcriptional regulator [Mycobacteroides immunogenum]
MTQIPDDAWSDRLCDQIAQAIREKRGGVSAAELARRTNGQMSRDMIANLETRKKRPITVPELIILADALGVAPLSLIYPRTGNVEAAPGHEPVPGIDATLWFAGYNHHDDNEMVDVYRYADARAQYEEYKLDPDEAERLSARSLLGQAKRHVRKQGWAVD